MFLVHKSGMLCTGITHQRPSASVFSDGVSCPSFLLLGSFPCGGWQASPVNFSAVPFSMTRAFEVAPTKSYPMNLSLDVGDIS